MYEWVSKKYIQIFSLLNCFTKGKLCTANIKEYLFVFVFWMPELICCFIAEAVLPNSVKELSLRVWTGASAFNERDIYI